MREIGSYKRPAFLGDHPPVLARMILDSDGKENTLLAGSVLGRNAEGKLGLYSKDNSDVVGILAGDVVVPVTGGAYATVYIHANVVAEALIFEDGLSAEDEKRALVALRQKGIYSSVTWAEPEKTSGGE